MNSRGLLPNRSKKTTTDKSVGVLYHERFHLKFFFVKSKLPAALLVSSIFFLWLLNTSFEGLLTPVPAETAPGTEAVDAGQAGEIFTAMIEAAISVLTAAFHALVEALPVVNLSWLPWLGVAWWLFVTWAVARSWFRWFRSYAEVSDRGFTIYTPKSFWFALGTKSNRTVPASMVYDADEASSMIDNTLFMKTVSRVNVFVRDTAGEEDAVVVKYARYANELVEAVKSISQPHSATS